MMGFTRDTSPVGHIVALAAKVGEKILAAIDDLNSAVTSLASVVSGVLAHEQTMTALIAQLQAQIATLPADQSAGIEAAVTQIQASVSSLTATLPTATTPTGTGTPPAPSGTGGGTSPVPTGGGTPASP